MKKMKNLLKKMKNLLKKFLKKMKLWILSQIDKKKWVEEITKNQ